MCFGRLQLCSTGDRSHFFDICVRVLGVGFPLVKGQCECLVLGTVCSFSSLCVASLCTAFVQRGTSA